MSEEYSDYSEIFTPTDPRDRWDEHMISAMSGTPQNYTFLWVEFQFNKIFLLKSE